MNADSRFETVIGLEIHTQLRTRSKIFCGCPNQFGSQPNTQICPVCAAFPGVLPVLNREVLNMAIKTGLALNGQIRLRNEFSRKNYFYPDLPAGYQISQFELPIVEHGELMIEPEDGPRKRIGITRIHMEVDAGKNLHEGIIGASWVDLNRTGTPLLEIVTEPDLRSAAETGAFLKKLRAIVRYLEVCDGNMEEGSFRCDANVSVRRWGETKLGTRAEIKNLNSIRNVMRAIEFEVDRQIDRIENGEKVIQETRLWDANQNLTRSMRGKEEAHDYRYFPEPDLPPVLLDPARIETIRATLPELPDQKFLRFQDQYGLSDYDAGVLTANRELAEYFESAVRAALPADPKVVANWVTGELLAFLNKEGLEISQSPVQASALGALTGMIHKAVISGKIAKTVFAHMCVHGGEPQQIVLEKGLTQVTDQGAIEAEVERILGAHADKIAQYRAGKTQLLGFFVGEVMKATRGKANPGVVNELLINKLST
ncbi:MAG: Asp-tRNA(Asn)/Glu-tRNA(Gln) amidotransferase subunit GatB [Magnetococcales bacterium]|nr:Asp-tRNA(Asn)/Glu-tRNA(Gln) amidotransferase subunit GatB [Magnetococcales bacterium]MBF0439569.1 Asp-tRNA(Asn)/Glu-tRNA(Gln) amidotransferase subunit GatB [Magnetococcales bacterium]